MKGENMRTMAASGSPGGDLQGKTFWVVMMFSVLAEFCYTGIRIS